MKYSIKVFISVTIIISVVLSSFSYWLMKELRDQYAETIEESLVDLSNILASYLSAEIKNGIISTETISRSFLQFKASSFKANIHGVSKQKTPVDIYVTDSAGVIVYDSRDEGNIGKDYSLWNDVYLTLRGKYGARSTKSDESDPLSSVFYIASPILYNNSVLGVLSVIKPESSLSGFVKKSRSKIMAAALLILLASLLATALLSYWLTKPISSLMSYANKISKGESARLPRLSSLEFDNLGRAFDKMRISLEGKETAENFVQNLMHELKSPLAAIQSAGELLEDNEMPKEDRERFVSNIITGSKRVKNQLDDLLHLTALEKINNFEMTKAFDLYAAVENLRHSLGPLIDKKKIIVDFVADRSSYIITGEKTYIAKAISNILLNAIEFSPISGEIRIRLYIENNFLVVIISDDGPGVPGYAQKQIFNKFYSLERPDTGHKSTGLGLSFSKEVVLLHGGDLSFMPKNKGASFRLSLPI